MRIISGKYKGRIISMPKGIRPTQQKIRKAIFDILADFIKGASFLELFAGTGAVGIEALSYGVASVCFVEKNPQCLKAIRQNLESLKIDTFSLLLQDALYAIKLFAQQNQKFEIIFLDPPYYKGGVPRLRPSASLGLRWRSTTPTITESLSKKSLLALANYDILAPNGFVMVQHSKKDILEDSFNKLSLYTRRRYGDNLLSFYQREC